MKSFNNRIRFRSLTTKRSKDTTKLCNIDKKSNPPVVIKGTGTSMKRFKNLVNPEISPGGSRAIRKRIKNHSSNWFSVQIGLELTPAPHALRRSNSRVPSLALECESLMEPTNRCLPLFGRIELRIYFCSVIRK